MLGITTLAGSADRRLTSSLATAVPAIPPATVIARTDADTFQVLFISHSPFWWLPVSASARIHLGAILGTLPPIFHEQLVQYQPIYCERLWFYTGCPEQKKRGKACAFPLRLACEVARRALAN